MMGNKESGGFWVSVVPPPHVCPIPELGPEDQQEYGAGSTWECNYDQRLWRISGWVNDTPQWSEVTK
jgi:hypothetical protein